VSERAPDPAPPAPPAARGSEGDERAGVGALVRDLLSFDRRALVILLYAPLALTVLEYVFVPAGAYKRPNPPWTADLFLSLGRSFPTVPADLWPWLWWSAGCLFVWLLVPLVLLRTLVGARPAETGIRLRGTGRDARIYLLLFVVFSPVVYLVAQRAEFQATYPFYPRLVAWGGRAHAAQRVGGDWIAFEVAYFLQFLSVEYFFRGFLTLGLKPVLGRASVLVMLAPYCMIHYHKPFLEALGAVGAGAVLGCLSWRTRTVLYGWFLHFGVALTMDLLSLHQSGRL